MRPALTKLEFLVAGVLGLFAVGFIAMMIARHRDNAVRETCKNNLRIIGLAMQGYHTASSAEEKLRYLPPSRIADGYATWAVLIVPHLTKEHSILEWDAKKSYFVQDEKARQARVFPYFCPARQRPEYLSVAGDVDKDDQHFPGGLGDYGAVAGDGTADGALVPALNVRRKDDRIVHWESQTGLDSLTRGQSHTLLVGERHLTLDDFGHASRGDGSLYNGGHPASFSRVAGPGYPLARALDEPVNKNFGSWHHGVTLFLFADGKVQAMKNDMNETVLGALARRGE